MKKFGTKAVLCALTASMAFGPTVYAAAPQWSSDAVYVAGNQVTYEGGTYEAKWWTQNEVPGASQWGAWKKVDDAAPATEPSTPEDPVSEDTENTAHTNPAWDASAVYTGGMRAVYENRVYEAKWWVTGEKPDSSSAWKLVEDNTPAEPEEPSGPEQPEINEAPVLTGVKEKIELTVGDAIDVMAGITAADREDGDLTKRITTTGSLDTTKAGTYTITYTVLDSKGQSAAASTEFVVKEKETPVEPAQPETPEDPDHTEPPVPFWKNEKNYAKKDTQVYYYGKIYSNKWYANAGAKPDSGDPWVLVGDAEWTVPEKDSNYTGKSSSTGGTEAGAETFDKILTDQEIETLYGGINPAFSPEAAVNRLGELIPKSAYEELFPYRFGSEKWKACEATKQYYSDPSAYPDYYSYENLQEAVHTLANTIIKVQWYEGATWCYRLIRLDKTTREQKLIYSDPYFDAEWLQDKPLCTSICDYGSFLAEGDLNTRKRELSGFLANISHETGGGSVDGTIDDSLTGLYFNEEVGFIGSNAIGYVQSSGTKYLPAAGKSYHGRGPIQLSYNYNYGLCSDVLYGDSSVLLKDPDKLEQDGVLGFMTGIWFWMTPQPPKPSCHQVITGTWEPKEGAANASYNGNFGLTIVIINNEAGQSENGTGAVARRSRYYRIFAAKMGADITGEHVDTMGMTTFTQ